MSFTRASDGQAALAHLREICTGLATTPIQRTAMQEARALLASLFTGRPLLITRDHRRALVDLIARICTEQSFDAIHTDQLWMAPYALTAAEKQAD